MVVITILGLVCAVVVALCLGAAAWTWVLMLVAGAVHFKVNGHTPGFWAVAPVGILLSLVIGAIKGSRS